MAAKVQVPDYLQDLNRALSQVVDLTTQDVVATRKKLERELRRLNSRFYSILARKIVGSVGAPNLGSFSPPEWKPLAESTIKRKGHALFYLNKGDLRKWLETQDANTFIGAPEVVIQTGGTSGSVSGTEESYVRSTKNKTWVQKVARGPGGRFIPTRELIRVLQSRLLIYPFGQKAVDRTALDLIAGDNELAAWKLTNHAGRQERPIVSSYLMWWLETQVKAVREKYGL